MDKGAILSADRRYRYFLWRSWDDSLKPVIFIGLNPSTADEDTDDPTLRRCIRFAQDWGYGGVRILNLFALRTPYPALLLNEPHPIGPENDQWIRKVCRTGDTIVAAWGNNGSLCGRDDQVLRHLRNVHCLGINRTGMPRHPLYCPAGILPAPYNKIHEANGN